MVLFSPPYGTWVLSLITFWMPLCLLSSLPTLPLPLLAPESSYCFWRKQREGLHRFWNAFRLLTGWRIRFKSRLKLPRGSPAVEVGPILSEPCSGLSPTRVQASSQAGGGEAEVWIHGPSNPRRRKAGSGAEQRYQRRDAAIWEESLPVL